MSLSSPTRRVLNVRATLAAGALGLLFGALVDGAVAARLGPIATLTWILGYGILLSIAARPGRAVPVGLFILAAEGVRIRWLFTAMSGFSGASASTSAAIALAALVLSSGGTVAAVVIAARWQRRGVPVTLGFATLMLASEWWRATVFALPWLDAGYVAVDVPGIAHWARVVGGLGIGALMAALAGAMADAWLGRTMRFVLGVACIVGAIPLAPWRPAPGASIKLAALQGWSDPGRAQPGRWTSDQIAAYLDLERQASAQGATLAIWPEGAYPLGWGRHPSLSRLASGSLDRLVGLHRTARCARRGCDFNSAVLVAPDGRITAHHDKRRLVPVAEGPALGIVSGPLTPGQTTGVVAIGPVRAGVLICYEAAYSDEGVDRVLAGADLLIVMTSDAFSESMASPRQHLDINRMRAMETGRWLVRASDRAHSAIIAPDGRIEAALPPSVSAPLVAEIARLEALTPFCRYARWRSALTAVSLALVLLLSRVQASRPALTAP